MSRPSFSPWATGNYPAGANPWNGQPKRVTTVSDYFEPATEVAAPEINYAIGAVGDHANDVLDYVMAPYSIAANANTTVTTATPNILFTSAITANRNFTLSASGAVAGDLVRMTASNSLSSAYLITVKDQASVNLLTIGNSTTADASWADFVYTGTAWVIARFGYPKSQVRGQLVGAAADDSGLVIRSLLAADNGSSFSDVVSATVNGVQTGDIVLVDARCAMTFTIADVSGNGSTRIQSSLSATGLSNQAFSAGYVEQATNPGFGQFVNNLTSYGTVTASGNLTITLQANAPKPTTGSATVNYNGYLRVQVFRP